MLSAQKQELDLPLKKAGPAEKLITLMYRCVKNVQLLMVFGNFVRIASKFIWTPQGKTRLWTDFLGFNAAPAKDGPICTAKQNMEMRI